jgi:NAD(P)H-dependent flavin oxidoreductase YrpB (nitropropane dioxygenase family)
MSTGADILVAQGYESGGHTSRVGTMALVPQVVDAFYPTPVLAAGGIGDGRGLAAALALGASGVWMGTAFLFAEEAFMDFLELEQDEQGLTPLDDWIINRWREAAIRAGEDDTCVSGIISGKTTRLLRGKFIDLWDKTGMKTLPFPLQNVLMINLLEGMRQAKTEDALTFSMGQIAGMFKEQRRAEEIVESVVSGAVEIMDRR